MSLGSSGIHANGLTKASKVAGRLPQGYRTLLPDGTMYGEALLQPTIIYTKLIQFLFASGIDIHYMVNITGHGWRKLMRAKQDFAYVINQIPEPQPVFTFIQEQLGYTHEQMYGSYNMGAGFAVFLPPEQIEEAQKVAGLYGIPSLKAGYVISGPKRVDIEPLGVTFSGNTLNLR